MTERELLPPAFAGGLFADSPLSYGLIAGASPIVRQPVQTNTPDLPRQGRIFTFIKGKERMFKHNQKARVLAPAILAGILAPAGYAPLAQAQEAIETVEEIITVGSRGRPRTALDSAVPVDSFNTDQIEAVSHTDTVDILQTLVPSYNVSRQPISDGATFIRPAELRGLPPHHTLVLINGKRRHRASLVGIGGDGSQGPDVATIPSGAVQNVEVLRDGASSLYGSDAIAGVINFVLKDDNEGASLGISNGSYFEGDGDHTTVNGNLGLPLGDNGFISLSAEFAENDFTERAETYCEERFCVDSTHPRFSSVESQVSRDYVNGVASESVSEYEQGLQTRFPAGLANASVAGENVMPWGTPNQESLRTFVNAGIDLDNGAEVYGWGNYSKSEGDGSFFYRFPGNGTIELVREADGSLYSPLELFPGGFTPRFEGEVEDIGGVIGIRGENNNGFTWDVSGRFGSNEIDYRLFNTINPSYGPDSPTDFRPGTLTNEEIQFQIDLSNTVDVGMASDMTISYGVSYLDEEYIVGESSDVASYDDGPHVMQDPYNFCTDESDMSMRTPTTTAGTGEFTSSVGGVASVAGNTIDGLDCTSDSDPVYRVVGVGANGFPGYSPAFSGDYTRDSFAVYGEIGVDMTEQFFLQAALRYEDYSDFGSEVVGKVAGRYRLNDDWALRGSIGTGFRAPTPGQQGTINVSTRLPFGVPVATGLFPPAGPVAAALGAVPLEAETSTSFTFGVTGVIGDLTLTADVYSIAIDDRFRAISPRNVSTDPTRGEAYQNFLALESAGVVGANSIGAVNYFQNALDSTTNGLDVVASYPLDWGNGQETDLTFSLNWNESELDADLLNVLNTEAEYDFENFDPNTRWNLTAVHSFSDQWSAMGRIRYYGEASNSDNTPPMSIQDYDATTFVDVEVSYRFNDTWRLVLGGRNVFDTYPDETDRIASGNDFCCGRTYPSGTVVPWQGGYYYGRLSVDF